MDSRSAPPTAETLTTKATERLSNSATMTATSSASPNRITGWEKTTKKTSERAAPVTARARHHSLELFAAQERLAAVLGVFESFLIETRRSVDEHSDRRDRGPSVGHE